MLGVVVLHDRDGGCSREFALSAGEGPNAVLFDRVPDHRRCRAGREITVITFKWVGRFHRLTSELHQRDDWSGTVDDRDRATSVSRFDLQSW